MLCKHTAEKYSVVLLVAKGPWFEPQFKLVQQFHHCQWTFWMHRIFSKRSLKDLPEKNNKQTFDFAFRIRRFKHSSVLCHVNPKKMLICIATSDLIYVSIRTLCANRGRKLLYFIIWRIYDLRLWTVEDPLNLKSYHYSSNNGYIALFKVHLMFEIFAIRDCFWVHEERLGVSL